MIESFSKGPRSLELESANTRSTHGKLTNPISPFHSKRRGEKTPQDRSPLKTFSTFFITIQPTSLIITSKSIKAFQRVSGMSSTGWRMASSNTALDLSVSPTDPSRAANWAQAPQSLGKASRNLLHSLRTMRTTKTGKYWSGKQQICVVYACRQVRYFTTTSF